MRLFQIIFVLYILYLNVRPCGDVNTCLDEQKSGISTQFADAHDHNESEQDLCTPFCICVCCASHVQPGFSPSVSEHIMQYGERATTPYQSLVLTNTLHSIWQPPRV